MENSSFLNNLTKGIRNKLKVLVSNPYQEVNLNWLKLKYYKHLPPGKLRSHRLFGKDLFFKSAPELLHGLDEIFIGKIYRQQLAPKPYIIDCGANIGLSIIFIKRHHPDAEILAYEPDETNFDLLTKNVHSFGYQDVHIRKEAIWTDNTVLEFSNEGSMGSKIETIHNSNSRPVKAVRLFDLLTRKVDFLKIDIEGAEFEVLRDIVPRLNCVNNMFVEYHGAFQQNSELTELLSLISRSGFNYYIKEATEIYKTPFFRKKNPVIPYDIQLNIFCFRIPGLI